MRLRLISIVIIAGAISSAFTYFAFSAKNNVPASTSQFIRDTSNVDVRLLFYNAYMALIMPNEGHKIDVNIKLMDTTLIKKPIDKWINWNKYRLVFRYSYRDCDQCITGVLKALNDKFSNNHDRVMIITDCYSERDFLIKSQHTETLFSIYCTTEPDGLGISLEGKNLPYIFLLGPEKRIEKIFIPFKELPNKTMEYLEFVDEYIKSRKL